MIDSKEKYNLTIKNITGKLVMKSEINTGLNSISFLGIPSGMSIIEGFNHSSRFVEKVIVKK